MVGRGDWKLMIFNEKHHWVSPLVPTACAHAKLDGYFGKLRKSEIEALYAQGGSGDHLEGRQVNETKNQRLERKWGHPKRLFRT